MAVYWNFKARMCMNEERWDDAVDVYSEAWIHDGKVRRQPYVDTRFTRRQPESELRDGLYDIVEEIKKHLPAAESVALFREEEIPMGRPSVIPQDVRFHRNFTVSSLVDRGGTCGGPLGQGEHECVT